jgi:hypothetical protein
VLELVWLLLTTILACVRPRQELVLENLLLHHQLAVLTRPTCTRPRTRLRFWDKLLWVLARRFCARWREHLAIVTPETVVRWHRQGWPCGLATSAPPSVHLHRGLHENSYGFRRPADGGGGALRRGLRVA